LHQGQKTHKKIKIGWWSGPSGHAQTRPEVAFHLAGSNDWKNVAAGFPMPGTSIHKTAIPRKSVKKSVFWVTALPPNTIRCYAQNGFYENAS
jgi:hypothetical protein